MHVKADFTEEETRRTMDHINKLISYLESDLSNRQLPSMRRQSIRKQIDHLSHDWLKLHSHLSALRRNGKQS